VPLGDEGLAAVPGGGHPPLHRHRHHDHLAGLRSLLQGHLRPTSLCKFHTVPQTKKCSTGLIDLHGLYSTVYTVQYMLRITITSDKVLLLQYMHHSIIASTFFFQTRNCYFICTDTNHESGGIRNVQFFNTYHYSGAVFEKISTN
jgi:hypothetical protein